MTCETNKKYRNYKSEKVPKMVKNRFNGQKYMDSQNEQAQGTNLGDLLKQSLNRSQGK